MSRRRRPRICFFKNFFACLGHEKAIVTTGRKGKERIVLLACRNRERPSFSESDVTRFRIFRDHLLHSLGRLLKSEKLALQKEGFSHFLSLYPSGVLVLDWGLRLLFLTIGPRKRRSPK